MNRWKIALGSICVLAVLVGCSKGPKKPNDLPKLYPTTVKVVYDDGSPVAEATVTLRNAEGATSWNLTGITDAQGVLALKTNGNWDGAPAGNYQGMVSKQVSDVEEPTEVGGSVVTKGIKRFVAQKYGDPHDSGLTATVGEGANNIEFKVGEKIEEDVKMI